MSAYRTDAVIINIDIRNGTDLFRDLIRAIDAMKAADREGYRLAPEMTTYTSSEDGGSHTVTIVMRHPGNEYPPPQTEAQKE